MKFLNKNSLLAFTFSLFSGLSMHASAAIINLDVIDNVDLGNSFDLVVRISDLGNTNLSGFDIDLGFDNTLLDFTGYTLGSQLTDPLFGQDDQSKGLLTAGNKINLAELSWLIDFSAQDNEFVLATISFNTLMAGVANFNVLYSDLSDDLNSTISNVQVNNASTTINTVSAVSEPASIALLLLALGGISVSRRNTSKQ